MRDSYQHMWDRARRATRAAGPVATAVETLLLQLIEALGAARFAHNLRYRLEYADAVINLGRPVGGKARDGVPGTWVEFDPLAVPEDIP